MISVVVPIYNEEEIIAILHAAIVSAMEITGEEWEVVYVNDGSRDSSLELLRELQTVYSNVVVVDLSRNWGHPGAVSAGLQTARGDAVVLMDGDLQDPPEVIPELISAWRSGAQVVTAVRRSRQESRKYLAILFPLFYRIFGALADYPIPLNAGIFGLLDRQAVDSINSLREGNRYFPGLRAWVGYRNAIVYYDRHDRVGGEGKLTFVSRIKYAMDAITNFSYKPLRVSFVCAGLTAGLAVVLAIGALFQHGSVGYGIAASVFFVGSLLLFCMGILGEYLGRVYDEVRERPVSIINRVHRVEQAAETPRARDLERLFPAA
ncbi:MAG TPA: glycosyltransferase family 2 protein [Terriglobales bacterium]|nr:glycosyltransferase family 2 protein [Terriglobales bacterium]